MMIGAKTVMSSLLFVAAALLGWSVGLSGARLATLGASEAFWAGLFAFLTGSLVYRYWRLHLPSASYFRWCDDAPWAEESHFVGVGIHRLVIGENSDAKAFDFGARTQFALYVALAFWTGLITLDSRAVELIASIPRQLEEPGAEYCPAEKPMSERKIEMDPGCVLIRRAFELGYAKNLGPCEPKAAEEKLQLCTLRQRDEPFLHFAWRRLDDFSSMLVTEASAQRMTEARRQFESRLDHLGDMYDASEFTVSGTPPRASHHVFTNLPDPGPWVADAIQKGDCQERYRRLPHRLPATEESQRPSRRFEHVLAQLLFETRYSRAAGSCREYTVHWGAPADACDRLVQGPEEFLADQGALGEIEGVLHRYRVTRRLQNVADTASGMSSLSSILSSVPPQRFVSFHCWMEEERAGVATSSRALSLGEYSFLASEMRVPIETQRGIDRYHQVASMLVPTFYYGNLMSDASTSDLLDSELDAKFFTGPSGFLSRLDYLADVDLLLGTTWIQQREDLLDVYPWHVHLDNYVDLFRARYRAERGRL